MKSNENGLVVLAEAVADGSQVDWDHAESSAVSENERHAVQQLRKLAAVGAAARANVVAWGTLEVRNEIASGTFGTVYRAWDARLEREVALKLLHARHSVGEMASVVITEGRLLARIRHPNVVTVYGADTFDGRVGIWMELVTGRTLKEILQDNGPFGGHEAAVIGRDLCQALAAVHQRGFLHRDVKAQNVIREAGGRTVLMDFGAGVQTDVEGETASPLAGTPVYLAPEVLAGAPPTVRSDVYSLGVLLYHLVSGEFPVAGRSLEELKERHEKGLRTHLRDVRPDLPDDLIRAIDRATAANPAQRPESAGAMEASLEIALGLREPELSRSTAETPRLRPSSLPIWILVATAATITAGGIAWSFGGQLTRGALGLSRPQSIAVLPLEDLTDGRRRNDYFRMGVTDDISATLASLGRFKVVSVAENSARSKGVTALAAELGVDAVVDGSVQWDEADSNRVRVASRLVDGRSGEILWSERFDRRIGTVDPTKLSIQSEVSRKIAITLMGELSKAEATRLAPDSRAAARAYYDAGRYHWLLRTADGLRDGLQAFELAIKRDPTYAPAYSGLADSYTILAALNFKLRAEMYPKARQAAVKALQLDSNLAEAHASFGYVHKNAFEWDAAGKSFKRALELRPDLSTAHHWYGILLTQQGRFEEAIAALKTAIELDDESIAAKAQLAATLELARRYDEAIAQAQSIIDRDSRYTNAYQMIAESYAYKREYDLALAAMNRLAQAREPGGADQDAQGTIGYIHAMAGRKEQALGIIAHLEARERAGEPRAAAIATIYGALGQPDRAFYFLARAQATGEYEMGYLKVDPRWDPVRGDRRFDALLKSMRFID